MPVGRDRELARLKTSLLTAPERPLLICGTPGIGKSTLASAVLRDPEVEGRFGPRRFQVRCDDRNDVTDLIVRVASEWFGITKNNPARLRSAFFRELSRTSSVLLIDNYETLAFHADAGVRQEAREFLTQIAAIESVSLLVGCQTLTPPADLGWLSMTPSPLNLADSRHLFVRSTGRPSFAEDPHLRELLLELDGVPHAIVLIAQVALGYEDLQPVLKLWRDEMATLIGRAVGRNREETIAVAYEVSFSALELIAQDALSALATLPAGVSERVADDLLPGRTRSVGILVTAAVCYRIADPRRLALLSPLRGYVSANHPPLEAHVQPFTEYFLRLAASGAKVGITHTRELVDDLLIEQKNLEWAVRSTVSSGSLSSVQAVIGLGTFGSHVGLDYSDLLQIAIEKDIGLSWTAECLRTLADLERVRHRHNFARSHYNRAKSKFVDAGDRGGEAWCLWGEADVAVRLDEYESAKPLFEAALAKFGDVSENRGAAWALRGLADIELMHDRTRAAEQLYVRARDILKIAQDLKGQAWCYRDLAQVARLENDMKSAISYNTEAIRLFQAAADLGGEGGCFWDLGVVALRSDDLDGAEASFLRGQELFQAAHDESEAWCLQGLGQVASRRGRRSDARRLYFRAIRLFRALTNRVAEAGTWSSLATLHEAEGHTERSRSLHKTALKIYESVRYKKGVSACLVALGLE